MSLEKSAYAMQSFPYTMERSPGDEASGEAGLIFYSITVKTPQGDVGIDYMHITGGHGIITTLIDGRVAAELRDGLCGRIFDSPAYDAVIDRLDAAPDGARLSILERALGLK